jgi:hypothetical protein
MVSGASVATGPAQRDAHGGVPGGRRVLVLVGGLPGAGKTSLLARLLGTGPAGTRGLDSEQVAARLHDLGVRLPYRLLRPVVHALHRGRVRRVLGGPQPVVVLTDPLTSGRRRATVLRSARRAGREIRLLLLDVDPAEARRGQLDRRRQLGSRAMARHVRRWRTALEQARTTGRLDGVPAVVATREEACGLGLEQLLRN